jgi:hypothetical protein
MWLLNTEPPPEYSATFQELVSLDPDDPLNGGRARTRRGARQPKPPATPSPMKLDAELAAEDILRQIGAPADPVAKRTAIYNLQREILTGYFNPDYWFQCELIEEDYLADEPESATDDNPRPYGYRVDENLPTKPTYHSGLADSGPASYRGFLTGNYFHDNKLVWARRLYKLINPYPSGRLTTTFHVYQGSLDIDTDARGSRPMCSVIMKFLLLNEADNGMIYANPPTDTPVSFYWRFKPPLGGAPYYHVTQPVRLMSSVADDRNVATEGEINRLLVLSAPRPMFGYGQNNCSEVDTVLTGSQTIYQLNP